MVHRSTYKETLVNSLDGISTKTIALTKKMDYCYNITILAQKYKQVLKDIKQEEIALKANQQSQENQNHHRRVVDSRAAINEKIKKLKAKKQNLKTQLAKYPPNNY